MEIDNMITGNFWMRFVGRPDGKLMKNAPGNFEHGKLYKVPYGHAKWPFWELQEEVPELKVESIEESFEEAYYVPEESTETESAPLEEITMTPSSENYNFDPHAPATLEPYVMFNPATGKTTAVDPEEYLEPEEEPEPDESAMLKMEVARLQKALEEATKTPSVKLEAALEEPVGDTREDLLDILKHAGVPVKPRTRTTTLRKMVDALEDN